MTGEIIIADTIQVQAIDDILCTVSALVMGANEIRENAKRVSVTWNQNESSETLKNRLIATYTEIVSDPTTSLKNSITTAIGTEVPGGA